MPAELLSFGEYAPGAGGEFERECAASLRDQLPEGFIVATNVYLSRGGVGFYECDAIVIAPGICDILEMKCLRGDITVGEDLIETSIGFTVERPLSILDSKAKVLSNRRLRSPFVSSGHHRNVRVGSQVVVPSNSRVSFKIRPTPTNSPFVRLWKRLRNIRSWPERRRFSRMRRRVANFGAVGLHFGMPRRQHRGVILDTSGASRFAVKYLLTMASTNTLLLTNRRFEWRFVCASFL